MGNILLGRLQHYSDAPGGGLEKLFFPRIKYSWQNQSPDSIKTGDLCWRSQAGEVFFHEKLRMFWNILWGFSPSLVLDPGKQQPLGCATPALAPHAKQCHHVCDI